MHDNDFSVKEASRLLGCTPQNIYKQKDIMLKRGQWIIDENNNNYITAEGLAYLREKRAETIKAKSQEFNEVESNRLSTEAKATETASIVDLLQEQIKELKEEKEYWRRQTEQKDQELKDKNDYIQELNTKAFALLGTAEDNKKQEEKNKKGFFKNLFK